jgi:hypothetical protein
MKVQFDPALRQTTGFVESFLRLIGRPQQLKPAFLRRQLPLTIS